MRATSPEPAARTASAVSGVRTPITASHVGIPCFVGAIAGLGVAIFSRKIDRRHGILISLAILAIPTALLASAPSLAVFTMLRVLQRLCMATAFTLTLAHLGEHPSAVDSATASAAYITGNVASNFVGRFVSAAVADHFGLASNFYFFAALNLTGAVLVYFTVHRAPPAAWAGPWKPVRPHGRFTCAIPAFWGRLASASASCSPSSAPSLTSFSCWCAPFHDRPDGTGLRLFRVPSLGDHDAAGRTRHRSTGHQSDLLGFVRPRRRALPLLLAPSFPAVLGGLMLVGVGTFFAQAAATGYVSRRDSDRGSASGIYLSCYFFGGMVGSAALGQIFDHYGWPACVAGIGASLAIAALLASRLR
jgi:MFS transporter, YNFM family, putative membrane transport protein